MEGTAYFISCDWGTTNFRMRLVETDTLEVIKTIKTNQGVKSLYTAFLEQNTQSQNQFFAAYLEQQIQQLPIEHRHHLVIITGMASSTIGMEELAYADMPFYQSGKGLKCKAMALKNGIKILLLSGVHSENGMMRGEETQAIGLSDFLDTYGDGILLLPGTHSKHITYQQGSFTSLQSFMTGELFEVLSEKSILASSVEFSEWTDEAEKAFRDGLLQSLHTTLTAGLLMVRTNDVVRNFTNSYNFYFLSGLLIGNELAYLQQTKAIVFLAASKPIFNFYKTALEILLPSNEVIFFEEAILEKALLTGQKKILKLHEK